MNADFKPLPNVDMLPTSRVALTAWMAALSYASGAASDGEHYLTLLETMLPSGTAVYTRR